MNQKIKAVDREDRVALELVMVVVEEAGEEEEEDVAHHQVVSIVCKSAVCQFPAHGKILKTIWERFTFFCILYWYKL